MDLEIEFRDINNHIRTALNLDKFTIYDSFMDLKIVFKHHKIEWIDNPLFTKITDKNYNTIISLISTTVVGRWIGETYINIDYLEKMGIETKLTYGNKEINIKKSLSIISLSDTFIKIGSWKLDKHIFAESNKGIILKYMGIE